ncbi:MAG: hypothetical protein ACM3W4_08310 [Ignavibacteriales bacterium]
MIDLRAGGFKSSVKAGPLIGAICALLLVACGGKPPAPQKAPTPGSDTAAEAGYLEPPQVLAARLAGGAVRLEGSAVPNSRVRIASPAGEAVFAQADAKGRWAAAVRPSQTVNLYGVSMKDGGRMAQAEGYLLVTADGQAAQLRGGSGAVALSPPSRTPKILAVDYDRDGGAVVSGVAEPGTDLTLRVDRAARGESKADKQGRFIIPLTEPLKPGSHAFEVTGQGGADVRQVQIDAPIHPTSGPYTGRRTESGWRVDWMTPGGGGQTTLLFERPAA